MRPLLAILALTLAAHQAGADDRTEAEVQHLFSYVANSGCTFHRNGKDHDAADAADHLRLKYRRGSKYVGNADEFIDRLASESSWSGEKYTVTCEGHTQLSRDWLHAALQAYREGQ